MTAAEVKSALRRRYPATAMMGYRTIPGAWTCVEELYEIDLLALSATAHPQNAQRKARYPIIGHEVKVSRGDYRTELLNPAKRAWARERCHEFYFVTPKGLLKDVETAFEEPEWERVDFERVRCPAHCRRPNWKRVEYEQLGVSYIRLGSSYPRFTGTAVEVVLACDAKYKYPLRGPIPCETCAGRGYLERSRVELEAPTLWVPRDVGLIEVDRRGCRVVRKSPVIEDPALFGEIGQLARWISVRPDPRHERFWKAA